MNLAERVLSELGYEDITCSYRNEQMFVSSLVFPKYKIRKASKMQYNCCTTPELESVACKNVVTHDISTGDTYSTVQY